MHRDYKEKLSAATYGKSLQIADDPLAKDAANLIDRLEVRDKMDAVVEACRRYNEHRPAPPESDIEAWTEWLNESLSLSSDIHDAIDAMLAEREK